VRAAFRRGADTSGGGMLSASRHRSALLIALAGVLLLRFAAQQHRPLLARRARDRLSAAAHPLENAPPLVAFTTVALGGFRGLLVDVLWLRASHLQDAGKYFELVQLSDLITKLEPRNTEVWVYHAWNMAYNVSVMLPSYEDRWRWVLSGIRLLRDEGVRYNPGAPRLYCELGWLFQYKIGGDHDMAHRVYKQRWAETMSAFQPGPRMAYGALQPAARRRLKTELGLDADTMRAIDARYGPLDWRCPEAHAVYWAVAALEVARDGLYLPADRMLFQSLGTLFSRGNTAYWMAGDKTPPAPDPALFDRVVDAYRSALDRYDDETIDYAYVNFLHDATIVLARANDNAMARRAYEQFAAAVPDNAAVPSFEALTRTP